MLREALAWITAPCSPAARRLGYLSAAIALESRARRCRLAWADHLDRCHSAVRTAIEHSPRRRSAVVIGSGLALEYPLDLLAATFDRLTLVDIVHLPSIRRLARRHTNVALVEWDASGIAAHLTRHRGPLGNEQLADWLARPLPPLAAAASADWLLSANLLSQLPLIPVAYIGKRYPALPADTLEHLGRRLIRRHLDWLQGLDAHVTLIADAEQWVRDAAGAVVEHTDFATPFELDYHAVDSWNWRIAPAGELAAGLYSTHRVIACELR